MLPDVEWNPPPQALRRWAFVTAGILSGCAVLLHWLRPAGVRGIVALSLAAALAVAGVIGPVAIRPLRLAWMGFAWLVATVIGTVTLASVYFLVVAPIGVACRIAGRDPLQLRRPPGHSMWRRIDERADDPRRQF